MALLSPSDQAKLREAFAEMRHSVKILFFTQTLGCETCPQARQIIDELPPLSDKITVDEVNLVLDAEKAKRYGVDRVPALALLSTDNDTAAERGERPRPASSEQSRDAASGGGAPRAGDEGYPAERVRGAGAAGLFKDSRIRFLGTPAGYEFMSLINAVLLVGGRESNLTESNRKKIAAVATPLTFQVFTTPTWPHCPRAVSLAHEIAFANPNITAIAVEATEFPDLARRYTVTGVPKTIVNDQVEILGALPQDAFIEQALGQFTIDNSQFTKG